MPETNHSRNRLCDATSPYLLQHADNPVNWYPWGDEAFEEARRRDRPVFLSVGYSTCHWCHVMEDESFSRDDVADILNENFISIKVDREERPDIDEIFMNATMLLAGSGGWPNSVWLTPDGKPFYTGTYFPREDRPPMKGFKSICRQIAGIWRNEREVIERQGGQVVQALRNLYERREKPAEQPGPETINDALSQIRRSYDNRHGGFSAAPKFPPHHTLRLLIEELQRRGDGDLMEMANGTLTWMYRGGIYDQVGGGFHRYSTDEQWFVPHFEKMLYDNAQLAWIYARAAELTGDKFYANTARQICDWVLEDMTHERGGFYSAVDADSEGVEGKYYLWTRREIMDILGRQDGRLFCRVYGIEEEGNYRHEAAKHLAGANILYIERDLNVTSEFLDIEIEELRRRLERMRRKLLAVRRRRVPPHTDDKILAAWNGLMIGGLAAASSVLGEKKYLTAAERAAEFVMGQMRDEGGKLSRSRRAGETAGAGQLSDYAFMAWGLLELHELTGSGDWSSQAEELINKAEEIFADGIGGFYNSPGDEGHLPVRPRNCYDQAEPNANAVLAEVLVRLARINDKNEYTRRAGSVLSAFGDQITRAPQATQRMLASLGMYLEAGGEPLSAAGGRDSTPHVSVRAMIHNRIIAPGEIEHIKVDVKVDRGWHVNAAEASQNVVPTKLTLATGSPAELVEVNYPPPEEINAGGEKIKAYAGEFTIIAAVRVSERARGGITLRMELQVQPCSESKCLDVQRHVLELPVTIDPHAARAD